MSNYSDNILNIYGSESGIDSVLSDLLNSENKFSFGVLLPEPEELLRVFETGIDNETKKEYIIKYGDYNWYDWRSRNWGTSKDAYNVTYKRVDPNQFKISFETLGRIPTLWLVAISFKHHELLFEIAYMEEMSNFGIEVFQDGRLISTITEEYKDGFEDFDDSFELRNLKNKE
jgi:hypothetical protein